MNDNNIIIGIKKSCAIIADILGDISPIPGTGALLDCGIDFILKKVHSYVKVYEYNKILTHPMAKKLKIKLDYSLVCTLLHDGLEQVNALCFEDIDFESSFFENAEYDPVKLANQTIKYLGCLQEDEFADMCKALSFIYSIYLLHWIEQNEYLLFMLSRTIDHEKRISKLEANPCLEAITSFDGIAKDISFWNNIISKYERSIYLYRNLIVEKKLIREILPQIKRQSGECSLAEYVTEFFRSKQPVYLYLNGVGGSGKTVSLITLSDQLLEKGISVIFIPLNRLDDSGMEEMPISKWIKERILILDDTYSEITLNTKYEKMLSVINSSNLPFFLILDGVNEMNNPTVLVKELEVWSSLSNVSIIISSRNNEFYNLGNSSQFEHCEMSPLTECAINECLKNHNIIIDNEPPILKKILQLPQMIALYVGTSFVKDKYFFTKGLDWRTNNCISDIIHNYMVCQIADVAYNKQLCSAYIAVIILNYILPRLAWNIYINKTNSITLRNIYDCVEQIVEVLRSEEYKSELLEITQKPFDQLDIRLILFLLLDQLNLLDEFEDSKYWFTHQNFFDFFLCKYWINCAEYSFEHNIRTCWNDNIVPTTVEKYFSETIGKCCLSDYDILKKYWDYHKNKLLMNNDLSLYNLIRIMEQKYNWNLSHIDFSNLDLRKICLSGVTLSENKQSANFCGSMVSEYTFSPQGHHAAIIQAFFLEEQPTYLYTKDLHGNLGIYDIETDKRITLDHSKYYGGTRKFLLAGSSPNALMLPDIQNFLDEQLLGMKIIDTNTKKVEYTRIPRKNFLSSRIVQYIVSKRQWLVVNINSGKVNLSDERSENEFCIWDIDSSFRFYKLIENRSQSIMLLSLISKNEPYQEQIIRYEVYSNLCNCIYTGDVLVGYNNAFLSDDGSLLAVSNSKSCVNLIDATNGSLISTLIPPDWSNNFYSATVLLSPDNQWCVWYGLREDSIFPWDIYIWNIWKPNLFFKTQYSDIISSMCFSLDKKRIIVGLFDGSIDTILLDDFIVHRLAVGHRVDLKMYNIDNTLYVRRSDNVYQKWDIEKQRVLERPCKYSFPEQKIYELTQSGKCWYSTFQEKLKIWDPVTNKVEQVGKFQGENVLFSNESKHFLMEVQYDINIKEIRYCLHNIDEHSTSPVYKIEVSDISNEQIIIKKIHLTEYGSYAIFLIQKSVTRGVFEKEGIIIWDFSNKELKLLHWFEHKTIYLDQKYDLDDFGNALMICFHHPIQYYIVYLDSGIIKKHETNYLLSPICTSREMESIKAVSIHKKERKKSSLKGSLLVSPDGTIVTDSKQGYANFRKSEEDQISEGARTIYLGNALTSLLFSSNALVIGCETGIVLISEFDDNNDEEKTLLLNESDERVTDVKVMNTISNHQLLLAAQKDDNIYIWDMESMNYIGYLRSIPGTDIFGCDFHNATFESETVKRLVAMNGGLVDID